MDEFDWIPMDHRLAGGLPVGRQTEFDVDWISMEDSLGRRLGIGSEFKFDDCCFSILMTRSQTEPLPG